MTIRVWQSEMRPEWQGFDDWTISSNVELRTDGILLDFPDDVTASSNQFYGFDIRFTIEDGRIKTSAVNIRHSPIEQAVPIGNSKYLFGNGFNNEEVPEGTSDHLMPVFVDDLSIRDKIINAAKALLIPMYETTKLFGNILDWAEDFIYKLTASELFQRFAAGGVIPSVLPILVNTLDNNNDLIQEVRGKIIKFEKDKGALADGIAFAHSGFFAPLLGALELMRDDGSYFDVQTVISYEGPNVNWNDHIDNPNLKRIINVWGTAPNNSLQVMSNRIPGCSPDGKTIDCIDPTKKAIQINDFGPPSDPSNLLSEWSKANFTGSAPGGIENINIKILNARHNDFSYDATAWNAPNNQFEPERIAQEINRKTNKFMRLLYQFTLTDQARPGDLRFFLENSTGISFDLANQVWVVDPGQLGF